MRIRISECSMLIELIKMYCIVIGIDLMRIVFDSSTFINVGTDVLFSQLIYIYIHLFTVLKGTCYWMKSYFFFLLSLISDIKDFSIFHFNVNLLRIFSSFLCRSIGIDTRKRCTGYDINIRHWWNRHKSQS